MVMRRKHVTTARVLESLATIVAEASKIQNTISEASARVVQPDDLSRLNRTAARIREEAQDAIEWLGEVRLEEPRN